MAEEDRARLDQNTMNFAGAPSGFQVWRENTPLGRALFGSSQDAGAAFSTGSQPGGLPRSNAAFFPEQQGTVNTAALSGTQNQAATQYAPPVPTIASGLTSAVNPLESYLTPKPTSTATQATSAAPQPAGLRLMNPLDQKKYDIGGMQGLLATQSPNVTRNLMRTDGGQYMVRETINGPRTPALMAPETDVSKYRQITGWTEGRLGHPGGQPIYSTGAAELAAVNAGISDYNRDTMAQQTGLTNQWQAAQGGIPLQQAQAAEASAKAATAPEDSRTQGLLRTAMARQADAAANQGKYILGTEEVSAGRNPITQQQEFRKVSVPYSARTGERVVTARERLQDIMSNLSTEQQSKLRTELGGKNLSDAELLKQVNTILYGE